MLIGSTLNWRARLFCCGKTKRNGVTLIMSTSSFGCSPSFFPASAHRSPRSGVVVLGASDTEGRTYTDESYVNDVALGADVYTLDTNEAIHAVFPPGVRIASSINRTGYFNREGGWANAGQGLSILLSKVAALNGKIFPGKDVTKIILHDGKTTGVECKDGTTFDAALVVIATGSWTPSAFPNLNLRNMCLATG